MSVYCGDVPVVGGMTATGLFAKRMRRRFGKVLVDKSFVRVVPITSNEPPSSRPAMP